MSEELVRDVEASMGELNDFSHELLRQIEEEGNKPKRYIEEVTKKIEKFQIQIDKHFEHQHSENEKMQKDITDLKGDKTAIEQDLIGSSLADSGYVDWLNYLELKIGTVQYNPGMGSQ